MTPPPSIAENSPVAAREAWEHALGELEHLAATDVPGDAFRAALLRLARDVGRTPHVRLLERTADGVWPATDATSQEQTAWNHRLLTLPRGTTTPLHATTLQADAQGAMKPEAAEFVLWRCEDDRAGAIALTREAPLERDHAQSQERAAFLVALAELAADHQRRAGLRDVRARTTVWHALWECARRWSECEDLPGVAQATVEDLQHRAADLGGMQRTALVMDRGVRKPAWRIVAASGATAIDERSDVARLLGRLTERTSQAGRALSFGDVPSNWSTEIPAYDEILPGDRDIDALWHDYVEASAARGMIVVPWQAAWLSPRSQIDASESKKIAGPALLRVRVECPGIVHDEHGERDDRPADRARNLRGAWIFERFTPQSGATAPLDEPTLRTQPTPATELLPLFLHSAASAVERARRFDDLPGIGFARRWAAWRRGWRDRGITLRRVAVLMLALVCLALLLIPADFAISARGRLWPVARREIFAPEDAVVARVAIRHGEAVAAQQALIELVSPELERQRVELRGELATTEQRLVALRAERLRLSGSGAEELAQADRLTAEEAELQIARNSALEQAAILDRRREALIVRSPIAGRVLTWNPVDALAGQPVRRGQALLTVADPQGAWLAELRIDEDEAGYVRSAMTDNAAALNIEIRAATAPEERLPASLSTLAERSEHDAVWGTGLRAEALLKNQDETLTLGPGTAATARIPCGRRALGFVLFRDVIDAWRNW